MFHTYNNVLQFANYEAQQLPMNNFINFTLCIFFVQDYVGCAEMWTEFVVKNFGVSWMFSVLMNCTKCAQASKYHSSLNTV